MARSIAEGSVVAVQYHPGATIVAARFLHAVPKLDRKNHDSILFIIAGVIACFPTGGAVVERAPSTSLSMLNWRESL